MLGWQAKENRVIRSSHMVDAVSTLRQRLASFQSGIVETNRTFVELVDLMEILDWLDLVESLDLLCLLEIVKLGGGVGEAGGVNAM